jgi:hypothetical protein
MPDGLKRGDHTHAQASMDATEDSSTFTNCSFIYEKKKKARKKERSRGPMRVWMLLTAPNTSAECTSVF